MQEDFAPKKPKSLWKVKALAAIVPLSGLVMAASAADLDLNATIGPILDSVTELIPSIIALIVSIVPAIIVMSVIGFVIGFFDKILGMMKLK
jgi:hypothetical protein